MSAFPFNSNGKLTTIAGQISKSKQVDVNYALDPELDYEIFVETQAAPVLITLPLGVDGQEFYVQDFDGNSSVNNITFAPTAPNLIVQPAPTINTNFGSRRWIFKTVTIPGPVTFGVWYYEQESASGGGTPTGTPNTGAYFDGAGNLNSNANFKFTDAENAMSFGLVTGPGTVDAGNNGAFAHGEGQSGSISSNGIGSEAFGNSINGSAISSTSDGSVASGQANNTSTIEATGLGSVASGRTDNNGVINASAEGSEARGFADGAASAINSTAFGTEARGSAANGGIISASQVASRAIGSVTDAGTQLTASGIASQAVGSVSDSATLLVSGEGAFAFGKAANAGSNIQTSGAGSLVYGVVSNGGVITNSSDGAHARGIADGAGSNITIAGTSAVASGVAFTAGTIVAAGIAAWANGEVQNGGAIAAASTGSIASGSANGTSCAITSSGPGSLALGNANSAFAAFPSVISSSSDGNVAFGYAQDGGQIQCSGQGGLAFGSTTSDGTQYAVIVAGGSSLAFGYSLNGGTIQSNGGGLCYGFVTDTGSLVRASGSSSLCFGRAATGGLIEASGNASIAIGTSVAVGDPHYASGVMSFNFGQSTVNPVMLCFSHGRFASIAGSSNAWVDTDPLFVLGIGTATGSEENALVIAKNADIRVRRTVTAAGTTGAQTIDKPVGSVNFAAAASSLVVTNALVDANSIVICTVLTNDATAVIKNVVPGGGSFTITLNAAATAETRVGFMVIN